MAPLFNRPTWAKPHNNKEDEDSDTNIFSHSNQYLDIVADQERRKKENLERKKVKAERRTSDKQKRVKEENDGNVLKKRRITLEDGEALLKKVGLSASLTSGAYNDEEVDGEVTELVRRSPRNNKHQRNDHTDSPLKPTRRRTEVVQIQDGSDDDGDETVIQQVRVVDPIEENESEDEFAELKRQARLRREQSGHHNQRSGRGAAPAHMSSSNGGVPDNTSGKPSIPDDEPVVQLFISSRIPNTGQLLVYRKLSQPLDLVRKSWCQKQGFSPEFSQDIFLIHRMHRVYNVTTCRSLGLEVDAFGNLTMKGAEGKEGVEKVYLEAVTEEIWRALKDERDREAKQRNGELVAQDQAEAGTEEEDAPKAEPLIRVHMVSKDREELRIKIKPTTSLWKVAAAYSRKCLDIDPGNQHDKHEPKVRLEFDGDTLDLDHRVQDTEISDGDIIHVYPV